MKNKNPYKDPNLLLTINNIILFIDPHGTKTYGSSWKDRLDIKRSLEMKIKAPKYFIKIYLRLKSYIQIL